MKKILTILLCLLCIPKVFAKELNVTNDTTIKYKWYKEEKEEQYYPKKDYLEGYLEDSNKIKYSNYSDWNTKNCLPESDNYLVEKNTSLMYRQVYSSRYLKLIGFVYDNNIKVYSKNTKLSFNIIINNKRNFVIDLKEAYKTDSLWFYIDANQTYDLELAYDQNFMIKTLSKHIDNVKILLPDKTWITSGTNYGNVETIYKYEENDFLDFVGNRDVCRYREILTYRYKYNIIPYDDEYHEYIDGYQPKIFDHQVFYNGELPKNEVIVTKEKTITIPETKVEYIYKEKQCQDKIITKTKYQTKEIFKIPKVMYLIISLLIIIVVLSIIKICRLKKNTSFVEHV